ncbi:hypothetical protein [Pseudomonas glycinae]|uniref:hypothetical protein n=1 Tax=Pseudomonas glycinae TaxID=1785145 RepID=UPI001F1A073B|nr:hypothetical protein [Pseudomonas glycinae]
MKWIFFLIALGACLTSALLGLTAGINLNPESTVRYIPNWGSVGDWVSGVGALLAVITSFLLVHRNEVTQAAREQESFLIEQTATEFACSVRVISLGILPCKIKTVLFVGPSGSAVSLHRSLPAEGQVNMPVRLESREEVQFSWRVHQLTGLLGDLSLLHVEDLMVLTIEVSTVMGTTAVPISQELAHHFIGVARAQGIQLLRRPEHAS